MQKLRKNNLKCKQNEIHSHTKTMVLVQSNELLFQLLGNSASSPDLASSDNLGPQKNASTKKLGSDEEVITKVEVKTKYWKMRETLEYTRHTIDECSRILKENVFVLDTDIPHGLAKRLTWHQ